MKLHKNYSNFIFIIIFVLTTFSLFSCKPTLSSQSSNSSEYSLIVNVTKKGKFYIGSEKIKRENLQAIISKELEKGTKSENPTILISAEKGTRVEDVVTVMDIAYTLKVRAVLATEN